VPPSSSSTPRTDHRPATASVAPKPDTRTASTAYRKACHERPDPNNPSGDGVTVVGVGPRSGGMFTVRAPGRCQRRRGRLRSTDGVAIRRRRPGPQPRRQGRGQTPQPRDGLQPAHSPRLRTARGPHLPRAAGTHPQDDDDRLPEPRRRVGAMGPPGGHEDRRGPLQPGHAVHGFRAPPGRARLRPLVPIVVDTVGARASSGPTSAVDGCPERPTRSRRAPTSPAAGACASRSRPSPATVCAVPWFWAGSCWSSCCSS